MSLEVTKYSEQFSACPQISESDIAEIKRLGFKSILNCRPDGEGGTSQPLSAQLQQAAKSAGLGYLHIPVVPGNFTPQNITSCKSFLANAPLPVLGFCRTGTRAGNLYKLSQAVAAPAAMQAQSPIAKACDWLKSKCLIRRAWRKLTAKG